MQQFLVDFQTFSGPLVFYAMQGDSLSRKFQLVITDGGTPWTPPNGAAWFVYFGAPGMSSGFYDTITPASGSPYPAITVADNVATVEIAAQALEIAGINQLSVVVNDSTGYQIASWSIALHIKTLPGFTAPAATVYYNAISGQLAQVLANAQAAAASATLAQSWAVGGTGTREGENTDNAQYYAQQAQSIAIGQLGWFATEQALQAAHPTGENGQWAIVGSTDTIWTWDSDTSAWVNSGATVDLSNYYTIPQANASFATAAQGAKADTAMQPAIYDPSALGVNTTVQVYTHTRSGTVNNFQGTGAVGRALLTADIAAGDTFTVNGNTVTAYMGAESAVDMMAGSEYTGRWVTFVYDSEESTLNFRGGGGKVVVEGLSADVVKTGENVTIKQGAKVIQSFTGAYLVSSEQVAANTQEISSGAWDVSTQWTALYDCKILFLAYHKTPISGFYTYEISCIVNGDNVTSESLIANAGNGTAYIGLVDVVKGDVVKLRYRAPTSQRTFAHVQLYAIR